MEFGKLKRKQVVSIGSGRTLGRICDALIDDAGRVVSIKVANKKSFFSTKTQITLIGWDDIVRCDNDVILVRANEPLIQASAKEESGTFSGIQNYISIALLALALLILLKSCIG